jgi:hypothetical protein
MESTMRTEKKQNSLPIRRDMVGLKAMYFRSGQEILNHILEAPNPRTLVQGLAHGDFYWLIKRVGDDDCLPILEQGSVEQWQYLLDMELWNRDRLDLYQAAAWLSRLEKADPRRLVKWLFSKGQSTAYFFFYRSVQVEIEQGEDPSDFPDGFFTLDGTYYIRVLNPEHRPLIQELLRFLAEENLAAYQSFLLGLARVLPAETEEQLYRMRGVRLAEHGFLPFGEAVSVYSPLGLKTLGMGEQPQDEEIARMDEVPLKLLSLAPFSHLDKDQMLASAVRGFSDPLLQDRIYLEFAGLCNQILSADGTIINDLDVLVRICRKAAGYVNLSLEKTCAGDIHKAGEILKKHPLVSLFRVGFGLVLQLKWEVARWVKEAWFMKHGLDLGFWGDQWGETIGGLLFDKPLLYRGNTEEEPYRDFNTLADLEECHEAIRNVMTLDHLFSSLCKTVPFLREESGGEFTFHPLLFNVWARTLLAAPPSFEGLSVSQMRTFFSRLRVGEEDVPYRMPGFEDVFVSDILGLAGVDEKPEEAQVRKVLSLLWHSFREEYEQVSLEDMDQRFSGYLTIRNGP